MNHAQLRSTRGRAHCRHSDATFLLQFNRRCIDLRDSPRFIISLIELVNRRNDEVALNYELREWIPPNPLSNHDRDITQDLCAIAANLKNQGGKIISLARISVRDWSVIPEVFRNPILAAGRMIAGFGERPVTRTKPCKFASPRSSRHARKVVI